MPPRPLLSGVCTLTLLSFFICSPVAAKGPVTAKHGMVVAQEPLAADVGLQVLKNGGNAIDAAVAVGFALAVTHPSAGNIGGGGFLLVRLANGEVHFVDFREAAPQGATRDMYLGPDGNPTQASLVGWRASGVPGSVKGFETASKKWGSKKWADLLAPALHLARDGFRVDKTLAAELRGSVNTLSRDPESRRIFLRGGRPYQEGEIFRQPELASTLQRIAAQGGPTSTKARPHENWRRLWKLAVASSPAQILQAIGPSPARRSKAITTAITSLPRRLPAPAALAFCKCSACSPVPATSPMAPIHLKPFITWPKPCGATMPTAASIFGDPDFYHVPIHQLLSPSYIAARIQSIQPGRATPSAEVHPGPLDAQSAGLSPRESAETTHFNVVDAQGNAVAVTYTLNGGFGSGVTAPGLGFLLNNEMDDFVAKPGSPNMFGLVGGEANSIGPANGLSRP